MEWDLKKCLYLISLYKNLPELWQPDHKFYLCKIKKNDAWDAIARELQTTSVIVRQKMNSLLSSYRREKLKEESSKGAGPDEIYKSKWYAYKALSFLRKRKKTISSHMSNKASQENVSQLADLEDSPTIGGEPIESKYEADQDLTPQSLRQESLHSPREEGSKPTAIKRKKLQAHPSAVDQVANIPRRSRLRDASDVFCEHIAMKLKTYTRRTQALVQHQINNILFEADMGNYELPIESSHWRTASSADDTD